MRLWALYVSACPCKQRPTEAQCTQITPQHTWEALNSIQNKVSRESVYRQTCAQDYDFCFHLMPRCLMFPLDILECNEACQFKSKSNSKPHRLLKRNFCISIIANDFSRMWESDLFQGASLCTCMHMQSRTVHDTHHTCMTAWHLCKSTWHLNRVFFSFPIQF